MEVKWNALKSERLKKVRGVSFEDIIKSKLLGIRKHPRLENQKIILFQHKGYVWVVPFIEEQDGIFLKTLYPSRKFNKLFEKGDIS